MYATASLCFAHLQGVGYYSAITTWDKGEYACANNIPAQQYKDDIQTIRQLGLLALLPQQNGNTFMSASNINLASNATYPAIFAGSAFGLIP